MLIELYTTQEGVKVYWDTELEIQDPLALAFVNAYDTDFKSERREIEIGNPSNYRIIEKNYSFKKIYNIKKTIKYKNRIVSAMNGEVVNTSATLEEVPQVWHDETCSIQIVMIQADNLKMLSYAPYYEFAEYCVLNNILPHLEYENTYVYVNYIAPDHYAMFESARENLGIIITINTKE